MTKIIKVNRLQELAASLTHNQQLSNSAQCDVKGGCTTCQDIRIPPQFAPIVNYVSNAIKTYTKNN
jgi:hypothetical protein